MSEERRFLETLRSVEDRLGSIRPAVPFEAATPFPHVVLDGVFDELILDAILREFPDPNAIDWTAFDNPHERKLATKHASQIPPLARSLIGFLNTSPFVDFVEELTGIRGLIPDPHVDGGGLHQIERGGKLGIHSDFLVQQRLKLDRRLNLILYLNRDWREEWGGHLELWDRDMTAAQSRILPLFNRMVIFSTTARSFHGHPEPLQCPPDRTRKSIALYYYTNGRPAEEEGGIRPTVFQLRPGERISWRFRQIAKRLLPPILSDLRYRKRR